MPRLQKEVCCCVIGLLEWLCKRFNAKFLSTIKNNAKNKLLKEIQLGMK